MLSTAGWRVACHDHDAGRRWATRPVSLFEVDLLAGARRAMTRLCWSTSRYRRLLAERGNDLGRQMQEAMPVQAAEHMFGRIMRAGLRVRRRRGGGLPFGHRLSPVGMPRGRGDGGHARRLRLVRLTPCA